MNPMRTLNVANAMGPDRGGGSADVDAKQRVDDALSNSGEIPSNLHRALAKDL
jgi:hypothetical protein